MASPKPSATLSALDESARREAGTAKKASPPLCVCSYEDRTEAMDSVVLMGESLCRVDPDISLHLTVPAAPPAVRAWAARWPQVVLSSDRPSGVAGWDVKPWLLLQELGAGRLEALWLDADMIVTRPVSAIVASFPPSSLLVADEWDLPAAVRLGRLWGMADARAVFPVNSCFVRVIQSHQPLLERWLQMTRDPRYREAQRVPFERRPFHLASDQPLLTALLGSQDFGGVSFDYIRLGRHIAQCAGSSGYRPHDRMLDLLRGLPPLIHCIGRKPYEAEIHQRGIGGLLADVASDVSPYVLAARQIAGDLDMHPAWLDARTSLGVLLRGLTRGHPGMAGLPLAVPHALLMKVSGMIRALSNRTNNRTVGQNAGA